MEGGGAGNRTAAGSDRVLLLFQRALRVDDATARFYLEEGGGDVREAVALFHRDREWEEGRRLRGGRR